MLRTSESIKTISKALLEAQKLMGSAKKDSKNPFFKSTYADLGSVMEVCKEALNANGISVMQPATVVNGKHCITTRLQHECGEFYEADSEVVVSKPNDPQAKGAGETYTRRFSLQAFLFIPSEDDDGNTAAGRTAAQAKIPTGLPRTPGTTSVITTTQGLTTAAKTVNAAAAQGLQAPAVNAEFDAIPKPQATTIGMVATEPSVGTTQTLEPLKKSSFRNKATPKAATTAPATTTDDNGWN